MRRHLRLHSTALVSLTLLALPALRGDVTLRYKTKVEVNPNLPQQMTEAMAKSMNASLPPANTQQFKNGKAFYSSGNLTSNRRLRQAGSHTAGPSGQALRHRSGRAVWG
ncbi:MAG: hypothetical protein ACLQU1_30025 [Bryobacteraceae bacterium]